MVVEALTPVQSHLSKLNPPTNLIRVLGVWEECSGPRHGLSVCEMGIDSQDRRTPI